ncbi:MAG: PilN domain-containing protein [Planctomycetota bacterium]
MSKTPRTTKLAALVLPAPGAGAPRLAVCAHGQAVPSISLSKDLALAKPEALGAAVPQALAEQGWRARSLVIGLPAHAVLTRRRDLPPVTGTEERLGLLRLAAEAASPDGAMVFDALDDGAAQAVLVAAPRRALEQARAVAATAGLKLAGLTPTHVALAQAPGAHDAVHARVWADPQGPEVVLLDSESISDGAPASVVALAPLPLMPSAGSSNDSDSGQTAGPAAGAGLSAEGWAGAVLRAVLGHGPSAWGSAPRLRLAWCPADATDAPNLHAVREALAAQADVIDAPAVDAAAALADAWRGAATQQPPLIDLSAGRLDPPAEPRWNGARRRLVWAAAIVALVIGGLGWTAWDAQQRVAKLSAERDKLEPLALAVEETFGSVRLARPWFDQRPEMLRALADLTRAAPTDGSVWATRLRLDEDGRATFSGRAASRQAMLTFVDRLRDAGPFTDVGLRDWSQDDGAGVSFEVSLTRAAAQEGGA